MQAPGLHARVTGAAVLGQQSTPAGED